MYLIYSLSLDRKIRGVSRKSPTIVNIMRMVFVWHQCNLTAKESVLEWACMNNDDFTVLVGGVVNVIEWACVLCGHCIQNDWASRAMNLHQTFVKFEHFSMDTTWIIQKATAIHNWWLAASSWQCAPPTPLCITSHAEFFGKTSNHPGDSAPLQPRFGALCLKAVPQTKITFEREEISDCRDSGK